MSGSQQQVSVLLERVRGGDGGAKQELLEVTYDELCRLASILLSRERPGHTLSTGALANEAFIKLMGQENPNWQNRAHFFGVVTKAMRRLLVDHARKKKAGIRGGDHHRVEFDSGIAGFTSKEEEILGIDQELDRLAEVRQRAAELVELKFFAGLSTEQAAEALEISPSVAYSEWAFARAWLYRRLGHGEEPKPEAQ